MGTYQILNNTTENKFSNIANVRINIPNT